MSYDVNENGVIQNPGKFEGELAYVPAFWDRANEGMESETIYDGDQSVSVFLIDDEDRAEFPGLLDDVYAIVLSERDNGFVDCYEMTETALNTYRAECENAEPTEPAEDDLTTTDHEKWYQSGRLVLSHAANGVWYRHDRQFPAGRSIGTFRDDYKMAVRRYMEVTQYWPNVWFISDHGNCHLLNLSDGD